MKTNMNFHSSNSQTRRIRIHREFHRIQNEINNFNEIKSKKKCHDEF